MGVNLGGVQMIVSQDLLERADVHAVLQHQRRGGVAQLMGGILGAVQTCGGQMFFDQLMDRCLGDAPPVLQGDEQGVLVYQRQSVAVSQPVLERLLAGFVQKKDPFLVAFAQYPQMVDSNICCIQADKL